MHISKILLLLLMAFETVSGKLKVITKITIKPQKTQTIEKPDNEY